MVQSLLVGGQSRAALDGSEFSVREPSTGERAGPGGAGRCRGCRRGRHVCGRGVRERRLGLTSPRPARGRVLMKVATLLRERAETFAVAEARNAGKPIGDARWEVEAAAGTFEYYAGAANKLFGEVVPVQDAGLDVVLREPVGVCALIVPWNFPLLITCWKTAPALACGNAVIIKPASLTPVTALMLGELLVEAGVPEGCVSVIPGPGSVVGDALGERSPGEQDLVHRRDHDRRVDPARRRPTTSPASHSSSAGSRRASCSPTPTGSGRSRTPRWPCSATRARTAAPGAGSWSSSPSTTTSSPRSPAGPSASRSGRRSRRAPRWAR